jgi:hypothetical protein
MVFYVFMAMVTTMTVYLLKRDIKNNKRIGKLNNSLKTYIENERRRQAKKTAPRDTGTSDPSGSRDNGNEST